MNKPSRRDEPTRPLSREAQLKCGLMKAQRKASATGRFFCKFHKPIILGAAVALKLLSGTVDPVSPTPSKPEIQLQQVDPAQIKDQLLISSKNGDVRKLKDALQKEAPIDFQDDLGETPLITVSRTGNINLMKFLLNKGADPNVQDNAGWSALMAVSRDGKFEAAKLLLEFGADPKLSNKVGETALFWTATKGKNRVAKLLLEKGAHVHVATVHGVTSLMQAAAYGYPELCFTFLSAGAQVGRRAKDNRTARDFASLGKTKEHGEVICLLKKYEAKK